MSGVYLLVECCLPDGAWGEMGRVTPRDPPGSMSHFDEQGSRQLIVFECRGTHSIIRQAGLGTDYEGAGGRGRMISADRLPGKVLATLAAGAQHELDIRHGNGSTRRWRFTHLGTGG